MNGEASVQNAIDTAMKAMGTDGGRELVFTIVDELEGRAREKGVREIFLLTETAADYFERRAYRREDRRAAPASASQS